MGLINFLRNLASQLGELLGMQSAGNGDISEDENIENYRKFILELLLAEDESNSDVAVIYPMLEERQHLLNGRFAEILQQVAENLIAENPKAIESILYYIENLSIDIKKFPLGSRRNNIEIAITGYQIVLSHRETGSEKWATTQNNLGNAYLYRIKGEKADNLEKAIASYTAALEVYTRQAFPQQWAMTQNNLGTAYSDRIKGEKADNLELAIASYTATLEVYTRQAFPQNWAMTQNNLGTAYWERIKGEKADNLELAIASYTAALEVYTRQALPQNWATTQNNLGNAYSDRIKGEKADNLELAIASYTAALEVRTREAFPQDWAMTQNNLGNAYRNRIKGEKADNLEKAIASYTAALEVRTRQAFPQNWAGTQNNLGNAYSDRIKGEKADNLEKAIASYTAALEVYTRQAFPQNWAMTQNNLGTAYRNRIKGEKADNLKLAIASYTAALEVYTRQAFPQNWATTQNNLGNAYSDRIKGEKADNIKQAIKCYREALEIYTPTAFPLDCLKTGRNLGNLAFELQDWENAIHGYGNAISAVEQSREWATSQRSKREILENALDIYEKMVQSCINAQRYDTALLTIERSKSRTLTELLDSANLEPRNATDDQKQRFRQLRRQINQLQQEFDRNETPAETKTDSDSKTQQRSISVAATSPSPTSPQQTQLKTLQQQLNQLLTEINDPTFTDTQKVIPQLPDFTQLLDHKTALIEWYLPPYAESGFYTFIVTISNQPEATPEIQYLDFSPQQRQQLDSDIATYLSDYRQTTWGDTLSSRLTTLAASLHLNEVLAKIPDSIQKLILIPHCDLHRLPLHALKGKRKAETGYLIDLFPQGIQYAPSCQILERLHQRQRQSPPKTSLFAIQNPTEDLDYTEIEVETISRQFNPDIHILKRRDATKKAFNSPENLAQLSAAYYAHFSCHGSFDAQNPLESALFFASEIAIPNLPEISETPENKHRYITLRNGRRLDKLTQGLTLKEIFANLRLPVCRLVTLSACETGLVERVSTDEYIGLPSGFFYAGAINVVSSLWCVSDFATAFLMIRFYQELNQISHIAIALQTAQKWFKSVNRQDFLTWLQNDVKLSQNQIAELKIFIRRYFPNPQPFAQPQYWAAFCPIGL